MRSCRRLRLERRAEEQRWCRDRTLAQTKVRASGLDSSSSPETDALSSTAWFDTHQLVLVLLLVIVKREEENPASRPFRMVRPLASLCCCARGSDSLPCDSERSETNPRASSRSPSPRSSRGRRTTLLQSRRQYEFRPGSSHSIRRRSMLV